MTRRALPWLATAARLLLAVVFALAGAAKLPDPAESVRAVRAYRVLPEPVVPVVGYGLPVLEVALAVLLVLGIGTRVAAGCPHCSCWSSSPASPPSPPAASRSTAAASGAVGRWPRGRRTTPWSCCATARCSPSRWRWSGWHPATSRWTA